MKGQLIFFPNKNLFELCLDDNITLSFGGNILVLHPWVNLSYYVKSSKLVLQYEDEDDKEG